MGGTFDMTTNAGVFALRTPADLLAKLGHDYERLTANPADSYAAFDFFVTALHMKDWLAASGQTVTPRPGYELELWKVCSHLGNGSKHFEVSPERHHSIKGTEHAGGAFDPHVFQPDAFQVGRLIVHLEEEAATKLGESVDAVTLARKVLDYWERKFAG